MTVISISLPEESIAALEKIQGHLALSGRSEAVRASIRMAETEIKEMEQLSGEAEGVLIVVHGTHDDQWISMLQHKYGDAIKTQLHSHLRDRKCLEVMILSSDSSVVGRMMRDIYGTGKADYIKFVRGR